MNRPIFVCDFDGCLASQQKIWWEKDIHIGVYKLISDHDSWLMSKIKNKCDILILSGDHRVGKAWAQYKEIDFVHAPDTKYYYLYKYFKSKYETNLADSLVHGNYFYLGDSMPDHICMVNAKMAFYPKDASLILKNRVKYFSHILELNTDSGHGCFEDMVCTLQDLEMIKDLI